MSSLPPHPNHRTLSALLTFALLAPPSIGAEKKAAPTAAPTAASAPAPAPVVQVLSKIPHPRIPGYEIAVVQLDLAPGASSPHHRHPGLVVGHVVSGEFEFQITGEPLKRLRAGEVFFEPPGAVHLVSRNPSANVPARVVVFMEHPAGSPLVLPPDAAHSGHAP